MRTFSYLSEVGIAGRNPPDGEQRRTAGFFLFVGHCGSLPTPGPKAGGSDARKFVALWAEG